MPEAHSALRCLWPKTTRSENALGRRTQLLSAALTEETDFEEKRKVIAICLLLLFSIINFL